MAIEQKWPAVAPKLLIADGGTQGQIQVANTAGFKVKQRVVLAGTLLPQATFRVIRVTSPTTLILGPLDPKQGQALTQKADVSAYTTALTSYIYAEEQDKAKLKPEDIIQSIYRQEPGTTIGVELDDQYGQPYDPTNPLPTSSVPTWDEIDLAYDSNQNLQTAIFTKAGQTITLSFTYDLNQNLSKVTRVVS